MGHGEVLAGTSEEFKALHAAVGKMLDDIFGDVERVVEFGLAAYAVEIDDPVPEAEWQGTMPRTHITVAPTEKKASITIHIWHPKHPHLLKDNADRLKESGFKPMVGCLRWNKKAAMPLEPIRDLLRQAL